MAIEISVRADEVRVGDEVDDRGAWARIRLVEQSPDGCSVALHTRDRTVYASPGDAVSIRRSLLPHECDHSGVDGRFCRACVVGHVGRLQGELERAATSTLDARRRWRAGPMRDAVAAWLREAPLAEQLGPEWYRVHREAVGHWHMWWRDTGETRLFSPPLPADPRRWSAARPYEIEIREVLLQAPRVEHRGELLPPGLLHPAQASEMIVAFDLGLRWCDDIRLLRDDPGPGNAMLIRPPIYLGPGQGFRFGPDLEEEGR